ncbi:SL9A2-like protein [Mya arenaria]|uniref:Sodium/hydrogen exchanger n=1 Tax=Mya arenaria TaxID=6604 RepID=A0ABY7G0X6_MYAAR|nr:SL9A2-like protein [Mya arenaria]
MFKGEASLSLTNRSKVEAPEAPLQKYTATIEWVDVNGKSVDLLTSEGDILCVGKDILKHCIGEEDSQAYFIAHMQIPQTCSTLLLVAIVTSCIPIAHQISTPPLPSDNQKDVTNHSPGTRQHIPNTNQSIFLHGHDDNKSSSSSQQMQTTKKHHTRKNGTTTGHSKSHDHHKQSSEHTGQANDGYAFQYNELREKTERNTADNATNNDLSSWTSNADHVNVVSTSGNSLHDEDDTDKNSEEYQALHHHADGIQFLLIVLGCIVGGVLRYSGLSKKFTLFTPHEFFLFLLPPIILESAFSLHDRTFAENIGGVLLFAVLGTVLNFFLIGLSLWGMHIAGAMENVGVSLVQILVFSSLIVAVDPVAVLAVFQEVGVNNTLYFLVFGESLLNDGVTVVLYNVMQIFNALEVITVGQIFLGLAKFFIVVFFGLLLGIVCGLLSSFITKFTNSVKVVEPLIVFGFAYLAYLLSELFEFSGIVSIMACGMVQVHYAFHNITNKARLSIKFFAKVMATASEIIIFLFLGIVTLDQQHDWKTGFTLWTLFFCILYRFITTYILSFAINRYSTGRIRRIRLDEMFMISYGGLRGAVCFSLVALVNEGGTIKWLVKKFRVKLAQTNKEMNLNEQLCNHVFDHIMAGIEEIVGYTTGEHHIKAKIDNVDDKVIRPRLLRNATTTTLDDISHYYEKLVMNRHLDSVLALEKLAGDNGHSDESQLKQREMVHHRVEESREPNKTNGDNHTFFSNTLHAVRSSIDLEDNDETITRDRKIDLISNLRKKRSRNKRLHNLRTKQEEGSVKPPPKSLSFNWDGSRACGEERALVNKSENGLLKPPSICVNGNHEDRKHSQVTFHLEDTLEEEDETESAGEEDGSDDNGGTKERVKFILG